MFLTWYFMQGDIYHTWHNQMKFWSFARKTNLNDRCKLVFGQSCSDKPPTEISKQD